MKTKNNYFPALTGIRTIAAYMVYIVHTDPFSVKRFGQVVFDFFDEFHVGVTIFFVLSGFLIAYNYFDDENLNFKKYFINRFARIYPMYFLLTTLTFIFFAFSEHKNSIADFWIYLSNITFIRGFSNIYKHTGLGQGWTLTVEEMFYILAPLLFILIRKSKLFLLFLPIFIFSVGLVLVEVFKKSAFFGFMQNNQFMIELTFFGRCFEFFIGIGLALFIKKNSKTLNFKQFTYLGIIGIGISIYLISILKGTTNSGMNTNLGLFINTIVLPIFGIAPLFYGLIFEKTWISKILESNFFQLLGKSSYVFYLIHLGFITTYIYKIFDNYILNFLIINILAILLYLFIEKPSNIYLKKRLTKR
jgi:peptidoglycan/LPS O-acetylase OafA/YrhL